MFVLGELKKISKVDDMGPVCLELKKRKVYPQPETEWEKTRVEAEGI